MSQDQHSYKRASFAAIVGLAVQFLLAVIMGITALYADNSMLMYLITVHLMIGLPIWIILWMIFNQHRLERAETLEAEVMSRADAKTAAIFEEHGVDLQIARRRLESLYKWGLNLVGLLISLMLLGSGGFLAYYMISWYRFNPGQMIERSVDSSRAPMYLAIAGVLAFVAFIVARYQAGMAKNAEWSLLRSGASYLMGNFIVLFLLSAAMAWSLSGSKAAVAALNITVPVILIVIGLEILLGFLLNAYRPRRPGEVPPAPFDSRILGLLTSPKSLLSAFNEAINYQFGFEITSSWLYQLLIRALGPLALLGVLILLLMSSLVVVEPQQQALITRFGQISGEPVGPGPHIKWPWPIGAAQKYDVGRLHSISVGTARDITKDGAILWTNKHSEGGNDVEEDYLIAAPTPLETLGKTNDKNPGTSVLAAAKSILGKNEAASVSRDEVPGVSLVGVQILVQYRVSDLKKYFSSATDPVAILQNIASERLSRFTMTHDIDTMLAAGRASAGISILEQIKDDVKRLNLGFEVTLVTVSAVHPPEKDNVADSFQEVIAADQEKQTKIQVALKDSNIVLSDVAGNADIAKNIAAAIAKYDVYQRELGDKARSPEQQSKLAAELTAVDDLLQNTALGRASAIILQANAYRWDRYLRERAKAERFDAQYQAYVAAPDLFRQRQYLEAITEGLSNRRKIILLNEQAVPPIFRIDLKTQASAISDMFNKE
jgi:modulator of FtsH protease HflK